MIKKSFLVLMILSIMLLCVPAQAEEIALEMTSSSGFSFDLYFELFPDAFPLQKESGLRGYAELLKSIHIRGTVYIADGEGSFEDKSIEIEGAVIPVSRPEAGISFRLAGLPSHLVLFSPVLGENGLFFNNLALTEFALKTYSRFRVFRPWFVSFIPYCIRTAFAGVLSAWEQNAPSVSGSAELSPEELSPLTDALSALPEEDIRLRTWFSCLSVGSEYQGLLDQELSAIPDYLRNLFGENGSVHVENTENTTVWRSETDRILFQSETNRDQFGFSTNLPATESGFVPRMLYVSETDSRMPGRKINLQIGYTRESGADPLSLLDLRALITLPQRWPLENSFTAEITQNGVLLPQADWNAELKCEESGAFLLSVRDASASGQPVLLNVTGSILPAEKKPIPVYTVAWAVQYMNFFSVGDSNLYEFVGSTVRPLLQNILPFAAELPAAAYQEFLDDLTDSGIFRLLLGE